MNVVVDQQGHMTGSLVPANPWKRVRCCAGTAIRNPYPYPSVPVSFPNGQPLSSKELHSKLRRYNLLFRDATNILLANLEQAGSPDQPYFTLKSAVGAVNDSYKSYSTAKKAFWLASDDPPSKDAAEQAYILRDRIAEFFNELQKLMPDQHHEGFFNSCFNTLTEKEREEFEEKEKGKGEGKGKGKGKGKEHHVGLERPAVGRPHCEAWLALLITLLWRNQAGPDSPRLHISLQAIKEHFQVCCIYFTGSQ